MQQHVDVGWTEAEFSAAPEMATRLHNRILDLEGENDRMREALEDISGSIPARWQDGDKDQQVVYWAIQRGLYGRE